MYFLTPDLPAPVAFERFILHITQGSSSPRIAGRTGPPLRGLQAGEFSSSTLLARCRLQPTKHSGDAPPAHENKTSGGPGGHAAGTLTPPLTPPFFRLPLLAGCPHPAAPPLRVPPATHHTYPQIHTLTGRG